MHGALMRAARGKVIEIPPITGAEDFSHFAEHAPTLFFFVGVTPPDQDMNAVATNHSPFFYLDEAALPLGTRAMLEVALEALHAPDTGEAQAGYGDIKQDLSKL